MSPTRRALLGSVVPLATALAGCGGGGDLADPTERRRGEADRSGSAANPAVVLPRNSDPQEPVLLEPTSESGSDPDAEGTDRTPIAAEPVSQELIADADRASSLVFAAGVSDEDAAATRAFVEETDFETETLYVAPAGILSCYRIRVRSVSWESQRVDYEYCRELRPPEAACTADERDALAVVIRIPAVVEGPINRSGSGGHSPCRDSDTEYATIDATPDGTATRSSIETSTPNTTVTEDDA